MLSEETIRAGILGLCVGDALGVPVEFRSRATLKADPVCDRFAGSLRHRGVQVTR